MNPGTQQQDPTSKLIKQLAECIALTPDIEDKEKAKKIYTDLDWIFRNLTADMSGSKIYAQQTSGVFENPTVAYRDSDQTHKMFSDS